MTSILKIRPELRKEFAHIIPMIYDFLFFVPNLEDKFVLFYFKLILARKWSSLSEMQEEEY